MKKNDEINYSVILTMSVIFLFYFIIAILTPLTCDDWVWGSQIGIDRLNNKFANYNGRYLGNIMEIVITRVPIIKSLLMALTNSLIIYFITKIIWIKVNKKKLLVILLLLFLLPLPIFSQTYGWAAGFSNFNTSILFTLIGILSFRDVLYNEIEKDTRWLNCIIIFIIGLCSQLFAEHVTVYNVLLSIFILILTVIQKKKVKRAIFYFTGVILGAVLMLSNEAYISILQGKDNYRTIEDNSLGQRIISVFRDYMSVQLIQNNIFINLCISVLLVVAISKSSKYFGLGKIFSAILMLYPLYCLFAKQIFNIKFVSNSRILPYIDPFLAFLYVLVMGLSVLLFVNKDKLQLIFFICSFVLISSPLFFVTPLSPRCFLASYIFLVLIAGTLTKLPVISPIFDKLDLLIKYLVITFVGIFSIVFIVIHKNYEYRSSYIQEKVEQGADEIKFWKIPNEQFLWEPTPNPNGYMEKNFRRFYKIPEDTKLKRVELENQSSK